MHGKTGWAADQFHSLPLSKRKTACSFKLEDKTWQVVGILMNVSIGDLSNWAILTPASKA